MPNAKIFNSNSSELKSLQDQIDAINNAPVVSSLPIGTILPFGGRNTAVPSGFLLCNGALLTRADFLELFNVIGTDWGTTSGTNYRIPTTSGLFLRGVAYGAGYDPDRNSRTTIDAGSATGDQVGSYQTGRSLSHAHSGPNHNHSGANHRHLNGYKGGAQVNGLVFVAWGVVSSDDTSSAGNKYQGYTNYAAGATGYASGNTGSNGGNQTNGNNVYVNYIIKYE